MPDKRAGGDAELAGERRARWLGRKSLACYDCQQGWPGTEQSAARDGRGNEARLHDSICNTSQCLRITIVTAPFLRPVKYTQQGSNLQPSVPKTDALSN